ncbi:hypothetical protein KIN20_020668 [Parelaphostrongylus tenuis]|uniref:Uncharacterized protein n=1 Tax=Parelaphostrongylus tenuis TaxID=148309 RepID=A0AAD5QTR2_PARTN|nr:hypothetical protein KIN20_020668 [Parelaphostrongylus tenuis]
MRLHSALRNGKWRDKDNWSLFYTINTMPDVNEYKIIDMGTIPNGLPPHCG